MISQGLGTSIISGRSVKFHIETVRHVCTGIEKQARIRSDINSTSITGQGKLKQEISLNQK